MRVITKKSVATNLLSIWIIVSLLGCSFSWEPFRNAKLEESEMIPMVARVLDEQLATVAPVLEEYGEFDNQMRTLLERESGQAIVDKMLLEEQGSDYLRFSHAIISDSSIDHVLDEAKLLIPENEFEELSRSVRSIEREMREAGEFQSRALPPSQKEAFMRDLQKLITKTVVLMVAGIVYACIPTVVFWGKITAAAAISVAAGIVATTIMSIYRYYQFGDDSSSSFQEWMTDVTTDPTAAYAIAASMTTIGKTMANGVVVTGLIIVVFSIYQVIDLVKPLLKKYNFNA